MDAGWVDACVAGWLVGWLVDCDEARLAGSATAWVAGAGSVAGGAMSAGDDAGIVTGMDAGMVCGIIAGLVVTGLAEGW
jgi:hypothetical protein